MGRWGEMERRGGENGHYSAVDVKVSEWENKELNAL
jgi:hypothetical protein